MRRARPRGATSASASRSVRPVSAGTATSRESSTTRIVNTALVASVATRAMRDERVLGEEAEDAA